MKKELTYDDYEAMCQRYEAASFKCGNWWPSIVDIKTKIEPKLEQNLEFLIWIEETASKPETPEQKASQEYISALLRKTLVFVETKEELKAMKKEMSHKKKTATTSAETFDEEFLSNIDFKE